MSTQDSSSDGHANSGGFLDNAIRAIEDDPGSVRPKTWKCGRCEHPDGDREQYVEHMLSAHQIDFRR